MTFRNIGILFINHGEFGGPEKRIPQILNWLASYSENKYYFFLSERLFKWIKAHGIDLDDRIEIELYSDRENTDHITPIRAGNNLTGGSRIGRFIPGKIKYLKSIIRLYLPVRKWVIRNHLDVVQGWHGSSDLLLPIGMFHKIKTIYSITSSYAKIGTPLKWFGNFSYKSVFRFVDIIEFLSGDILRLYQEKGARIRKSKIAIAPCSFIDYSKTSIGAKRNLITFLAARFEPEKNAPLVVEVANRIINGQGCRNLEFRMMGGYQDESLVRERIREYNLGDYFSISHEEHPERYLSESLVFLSLQDRNNYPSQALLEAMACGCAIIATNTGETNLLVNEKTGFMVGKDPVEIAGKIMFLLNHREIALKMGYEARNQVMLNHTIERYGNYLLTLYN